MLNFFQSQMDYIFFLYGMSFFILSASCLLLIRTQETKLPWFWLGLFGFFHAINEWLDLLAISVGDNTVFGLVRLALLALSFIFLAEFFRLSLIEIRGRVLSRLLFIPWLLLFYLGWYFGRAEGLNFTCRYLLGFTSALCAGIALLLYAKKTKVSGRLLISALGYIIVAYSITQLVILNPPLFLEHTLFNHSVFLRVFGFPVQLLRCILAACAAFTVLAYWYLLQGRLPFGAPGKNQPRRILSICLVYLALAIAGWLITQNIGAYLLRMDTSEMFNKVRIVSAAVSASRINNLTASSQDFNSPDYIRVKEQFKAIRLANPDLVYVYLMRLDSSGKIVFLVDSEPDSSANSSPPGQVYTEAPGELKQKFMSGETFIVEPYSDRWGSWISVFSPVVDSKSGQIIALTGMDMDIRMWRQQLFLHRLLGVSASFCLFILFSVFFIVGQINRVSAESIAASQRYLQTLIDNIPTPVFYKNTRGQYLGCNFAFAQFYGLRKEDIIGRTTFDINLKQEAETIHGIDRELFSLPASGSKVHEIEILDGQGVKHSMLLSKSTYPGPDGRVAGLVGVMLDISERRKNENKLLALIRAVEQSPATVVITDKEGNITYVNPKFVQLTGYGYAEVIGKNPRILKSGNHSSQFYKDLWDTIFKGDEWRGEFYNKKKDGSFYWESASISPVKDSNGDISNFIAVKEDITERKRMLQELEQKNIQLQKLDQLKSDFISIVSHELRTPLSITKEGISLVLDGVTGEVSPKQQKVLTTSLNNIDRLARIINNLLDISKIESGKVELRKKDVSFKALMKNIFTLFEGRAREKGLELKLVIPEGQEDIVLCVDEDKITQVFTNLIGNAIKFTEKGYIEVSLVDREREIELAVRDTGAGIAADDLPKVFNKFLQFGRTAGGGEKGTGLGLSISKGLIDIHGGRIWAESAPGNGTSFIFTLPKCAR